MSDDDSFELFVLYFILGAVIGSLLVAIIILLFKLLQEEQGFLSLGDDPDQELGIPTASEADQQQLLQDDDFRQSYEMGVAFERQYPYGTLSTAITPEQESLILEKGVNAWEFLADYDVNGIVSDKTEITLHGGENIVQSNIPIPVKNHVYYFEVKIVDFPEQEETKTNLFIGLSTKPYPKWRMVGYNKFSVGYHANTGFVYNSSVFKRSKMGKPCSKGDIIGIGHNPKAGTVWFTKNGRRTSSFVSNMNYSLFPSVSADGPCSLSVNFGQRGFVFIEANVKKWGLAPLEGTLKPPPQYGYIANSVLLESSSYHLNENPRSESSHLNDQSNMINGRRPGSFFNSPTSATNSSNDSTYQLNNRNEHHSINFPPEYEETDPIAQQLIEAGSSLLVSPINYSNNAFVQPKSLGLDNNCSIDFSHQNSNNVTQADIITPDQTTPTSDILVSNTSPRIDQIQVPDINTHTASPSPSALNIYVPNNSDSNITDNPSLITDSNTPASTVNSNPKTPLAEPNLLDSTSSSDDIN
ncbi:Protein ssh4 [Smittium culicis]|uniref:Protein ssh4 n=2 Tax=Smittium culicis TaxID=133412 RepID=A0A1R1YU98_9FUNG|nr:Protein ssh4 [Smittium culicis]